MVQNFCLKDTAGTFVLSSDFRSLQTAALGVGLDLDLDLDLDLGCISALPLLPVARNTSLSST